VRIRLASRYQQVADAALVLNRFIFIAGAFEFSAQVADVSIDTAIVGQQAPAKCPFAHLFLAHDLAWRFQQALQDFKFRAGQMQWGTVHTRAMRARVERNATELPMSRVIVVRLGAPQYSPDSGLKFAWVERLRQIVVSTELQADNAIDVIATRRQHDHRHLALDADPLEHIQSTHARQHDVENQQVENTLGECFDAILARLTDRYPQPVFAQKLGQHAAQFLVVVDQENAGKFCLLVH